MAAREPRGQELTRRYKDNYAIPQDAAVLEDMILAHWRLEQDLTKQLLEATPENRWAVFERCYTTLYAELEWLNRLTGSAASDPARRYAAWPAVIGEPPKDIYEIGSGKGELIAYLAHCGYRCKGTEITRERGEKHATKHPNLSWGISDGIHLSQFESRDSYDVVMSDQVIEHLHPADVTEHFLGVRSILRDGGKYVLATPHTLAGPSDVSRVFKCDKPMGMHLEEYSYQEFESCYSRRDFAGRLHYGTSHTESATVLAFPSSHARPVFTCLTCA